MQALYNKYTAKGHSAKSSIVFFKAITVAPVCLSMGGLCMSRIAQNQAFLFNCNDSWRPLTSFDCLDSKP